MKKNRHSLVAAALFLSMSILTACASTQATAKGSDPEAGISDPFEGYNRTVFAFNDALDQNILVPIVKGYRAVVPKPARTGVHNVLTNLSTPITIGNQLLQGNVSGAGNSTVRLVVNTLLGVGGLVDLAGMEGIKNKPEDFGQTMAVWGVGNGPYFVPPLLAPGTTRDLVGKLVDTYADPVRLYLMNTDREGWYYTKVGVGLLDERNEFLDVLADLRKSSIDYYATIRSAYYQRRAAMIRNDNPDETGGADIPNYAAGEQ